MVIFDLLFLLLLALLSYLVLARKAGKIGCYVLKFLGYKVHEYSEIHQTEGTEDKNK